MAGSADGSDDDPTLKGDERIIHRARQRFLRCKTYYADAYKNSLEDTKFAVGDDRNKFQWPEHVLSRRKTKPSLTINIVEPHNDLVINEAMQNRASPRVRATGGDATADAAEGMQGLIDRTENISAATIAYRSTIKDQITGGFGYLTLDTAYINDKSFDQDVYIKAAQDPRAVYPDPDTKEPDGSDAGFGLIFDKMSRDRFNREHPRFKTKVGKSTLGQDALWITDKHVLVVMYYEREAKNDELIEFTQPDGGKFLGHRSQMEKDAGPELIDQVIEQIDNGEIEGRYRDVITQCVNWYLIGGDCILKRGDKPDTRWIGRYVPIIPCWGKKTVIEGKMDCKGHTRAQISPQQMLNYNASGQVHVVALQSKTPYIGPSRAFEANEEMWANANTEDYAYLAFDDWVAEEGEAGRPVAKPERQEPPQFSQGLAQGMQDAERWAMMVTGQWQQSQGQDNQRGTESGKAINARQRQGNIATQHFAEGQNDMFAYLGKQLIDIYPKLYDTKRILHVEGQDASKRIINIDPDQVEALQKLKKETETAEEIIFNPNVGEYEVISDPGPNYATQRQQAWDAMTQIIAQNQELTAIMGDLALKNGDFAGAQEMADRVKKWIKHTSPWLFEDGQDPTLAAMQAQIVEGQKLNGELITKLADLNLKLRGRDEKRDIDAFKAETDRIGVQNEIMKVQIEAIMEAVLTPAQRAKMQHDLMSRQTELQHELLSQKNEHVFQMIKQANELNVDKEDDQVGNNA